MNTVLYRTGDSEFYLNGPRALLAFTALVRVGIVLYRIGASALCLTVPRTSLYSTCAYGQCLIKDGCFALFLTVPSLYSTCAYGQCLIQNRCFNIVSHRAPCPPCTAPVHMDSVLYRIGASALCLTVPRALLVQHLCVWTVSST
jgi:hypothetical protein